MEVEVRPKERVLLCFILIREVKTFIVVCFLLGEAVLWVFTNFRVQALHIVLSLVVVSHEEVQVKRGVPGGNR